MDDYTDLIKDYDTVAPSTGMSSDPLDPGWYLLEVAEVSQRGKTQANVPYVKLRLRVAEGPAKGRNAFIRMFLGASKLERTKDGGEVERTPERYEKAKASVQAQMKGFMKAIGATTAAAVGEGEEIVFNFYNVDNWAGSTFVGRVTLQPGGEFAGKEYGPSNNLAEFFPMDDPKKGAAWLRAKQNGAEVVGRITI